MGIKMHGDKSVIIIHQSGRGIPEHLAPKSTVYFDIDAANMYINKDGFSYWVQMADYNTELGISAFTYNPSNNELFIENTNDSGLAVQINEMSGLTIANNLNSQTISAVTISANTLVNVDYIDFNTASTTTNRAGRLFYDLENNALSYHPITPNTDVTLNIGQENFINIFNNTGVQINNGQAVTITGATSGTSSVTLAIASGGQNNFHVDGVATMDIPNNSFGFITAFGLVHDLNLSGFTLGETVYLSEMVRGSFSPLSALTITGRTCEIGRVVKIGTNGDLLVSLMNENNITNNTLKELNIFNVNNSSSGIFEFSGLTTASTTTFNVAPAKGWIVDNTTNPIDPRIHYVEYVGGTGLTTPYLTSNTITFVMLNSGGTITLQPTPPSPQQRRENILLGKLGHANKANIINAFNVSDYLLSPVSQLRDMFTPFPLINNGVSVSPNGVNLSINNSAGTLFGLGISFATNSLNPNTLSILGNSPLTFQYRVQTGGTASNTTLIDPANYDLNGVITPIGGGANSSTNQRIYLVQNGIFRIQYGQTVYSSLANAVTAAQTESFTTFSNFTDNAILICILSVNKNATNLSDMNEAVFLATSKFGEFGGGTLGISTTTLQQAYNNSGIPQITTNSTLDGVMIRRGSASDSDALLVFQNGTGTTVSSINGEGLGVFRKLQISGLTSSANTRYLVANDNGMITYTSGTTDTNIYNSSGVLTGNRIVGLGGNTLDISGSTATTRFHSSGNLGVGTTTDVGYKLDVNGPQRINATTLGATSYSLTIIDTNANIGANLLLRFASSGTIFRQASSGGRIIAENGNAFLGLRTDGNLNLGTDESSTPVSKFNFHVNSSITNFQGLVINDNTSSAISQSTIGFFANGGSKYIARLGCFVGSGYNAGGLTFSLDNGAGTLSEIMRLLYTGNVLIGTTTDSGYKLNVAGTTRLSATTNPLTISGLTASNDTNLLSIDSNGVVHTIPTSSVSGSSIEIFVSGGTYTAGTATFTNNTGGTFSVSGFSTGTSSTDTFVTGGTFVASTGVATFTNNTGGTFDVTGIVSTAATIYNSNGTITTGRTVGLSSFTLSFSSATAPNTLFLSGGTVSIGTNVGSGYKLDVSGTTRISTSLRVGTDLNPNNGGIWVAGNAVLNYSGAPNGNTGIGTSGSTANRLEVSGTSKFSHSGTNVVTVVGSADSSTSLFVVQGSTGQMFNITDNVTGSLFSVNDISGLPIIEVFSDDTVLVGSYLAMALNTTTKIMITGGTSLIYSFPTSAYTGGFYDYIISGASGLRAGNIMAIWSGTTTQMKETATTDIGVTTAVTFSTSVSADTLMLSASATSGTWIIKTIIRGI